MRLETMKNVKKLAYIVLSGVLSLFLLACSESDANLDPQSETRSKPEKTLTVEDVAIEIPVRGNTWVADNIAASEQLIGEQGITHWSSQHDKLVTFFYVSKTGPINIGIKGQVVSGPSSIKIALNGKSKTLSMANTEQEILPVGVFDVVESGYQRLEISADNTSSKFYPKISHIMIGGDATLGANYYVKDDFYWGRRGPSVHLNFTLPDKSRNYEWFYNEITVPEGQDTLGSYYMANGFNGGYFGIQVNSATERRVLFSIWSPYTTDDPSNIPDEYKITLLRKGEHVHTGKFGNEGSGGQSYLKYNWKAGTTYRFLTRYQPLANGTDTDFTAYFYDPDVKQWQLIASFRRPKTSVYLESPYSFLENFITGAGQFERMATYSNQWVKGVDSDWEPMIQAKFTYDATARKAARLDYQGGTNDDGFYLKNTGFFSESTPFGTLFIRPDDEMPMINLNELP
ncbi:DUF3472 domain-containing protein [Thalassotalea sp. G2M2-11]|uniref:DUF3472 domain-containing protein n=1 Tax=Thalassotalea sp. G2M2-11 TaxID=2787627 RepID=UPI0019D1CB57|nr:DUF3472 domain-containing protein [Thalassotalea sp. G2M2-11]